MGIGVDDEPGDLEDGEHDEHGADEEGIRDGGGRWLRLREPTAKYVTDPCTLTAPAPSPGARSDLIPAHRSHKAVGRCSHGRRWVSTFYDQ